MRLSPKPEDEREREPEPEPDVPVGHYRVAGDLEVRAKRLEQELAEAKADLAKMEREVWAARKTVRNRNAISTLSSGGLGAVVGAVASVVPWAVGEPAVIIWLILVSFVLGLAAGMRPNPPDDGFPRAPKARLRSGPSDL